MQQLTRRVHTISILRASKMECYLSVVIILNLLYFGAADLKTEHDHFVALDPAEKMKLYWTVHDKNESISFALEAETTGWVGLGFSPGTGRMAGADIVIGWVKDGKPYLTVSIQIIC